jgi:hypothetical protein
MAATFISQHGDSRERNKKAGGLFIHGENRKGTQEKEKEKEKWIMEGKGDRRRYISRRSGIRNSKKSNRH